MRNLLAHRYHDIDSKVVWGSVDARLGPLEEAVQAILAAQGRDDRT